MTPDQVLRWIRVGSELITVLGVPVAQVIALFRDHGKPTKDILDQAEALWKSNEAFIQARIRELQQ